MGRRTIAVGALAALLLAVLWRQINQTPMSTPTEFVRGRNNTVLFMVNDHDGLSNVHVATAQGLLELYPDVEIHFATFPRLKDKLARLTGFVRQRQPLAKDIHYHQFEGPSYRSAVELWISDRMPNSADGVLGSISPPGLVGAKRLSRDMQYYIDPWTAEDHLALHEEAVKFIDNIDPAVVVLDTVFSPGIEATRGRNRVHAFVSPNTLIDNFPGEQPWGGMLWKFPAMGSGHPYPVPWHLIPLNIYLNAYFISSIARMPLVAAKRAFLRDNGVHNPINFYGLHRPDVPWLTQTLPGASIPVDFIPQNVTCTGPIVLSAALAEEQDPELVRWLRQKPTVLINLGSAVTYSIGQTQQMVDAITKILEATDLQVLWKYKLTKEIEWDWEAAVKPLVDTGRVKVSTWLTIDPPSLLETGLITAFVNHGGANGYHESINAGVPQIVLPLWVDLYNFAQLAEDIGVGVWGCREISPDWTADCLSDAILKVADGDPESLAMQAIAKQFAEISQKSPGREMAAREIANLARYGRA